MSKEKGQKGKQWLTINYIKQIWRNTNPIKTRVEIKCSRRVGSS
jgi:hypothetical protein